MGAPGNTTGDVAPAIGARLLKEVFNQMVYFAFRENNVFRATGQIKNAPGDNPHPGNPVTFTKIRAIAVNTTAISETADPAHKTLEGDPISITLAEYGDSVKATKKLRLTSFSDLDLIGMREMAGAMEESVDTLARDVLVAGTNVLYGGTATSRLTVTQSMNMTAALARKLRARLRTNKAPAPMGMEPFYWGAIHPDVVFDFQQDTGVAPWKDPQTYKDQTQGLFTGETGAFAGIRWVESANVSLFSDAGDGVTLVTSAAADDIIDTSAAHGFVVDQTVKFTALTGGTGLTVGTTYYVIAANLGSTTFQVSLTLGGAAVNFTSDITAGEVTDVDVYAAPVCGFQALGEAVADPQHLIVAGPFDDFQRFISIAWYFLGGFGRIREESLYRYEVASSIGAGA